MATELDALNPVSDTITLKSGFEVKLLDLNMRQIFKLFRIITHGMANSGFNIQWPDPDEGLDAFVARLVMMVMLSIGDAEDETIEFVKSMVVPNGLNIPPGGVTKQIAEQNKLLWAHLDQELSNPGPFDFLDIIERIIQREGEDLQALGKRIAALWKTFQKAGGTSQSPTSQAQNTLDPSVEPSTYSSTNTDTRTMSVVNLPSDDSDKTLQPSMNGDSTNLG